jgi:ADP-ribose pyrophosphatase YjhB (NUDIX family)
MEATFYGNVSINQGGQRRESRRITLPFAMVTARALVVRRGDGAMLGMVHHPGAAFALPGGLIDDGESAEQAVLRELDEENVQLDGLRDGWQEKLYTDYFHGYKSLSLWYLMAVDEARFGANPETVETRWIAQGEDVWHPGMREKLLMALREYEPTLVQD